MVPFSLNRVSKETCFNSCLNQNVSTLLAVLVSGSSATLTPALAGLDFPPLTAGNDGRQTRSFKRVHEVSTEKERLRFETTSLRAMPAAKIKLSWIRRWRDFCA